MSGLAEDGLSMDVLRRHLAENTGTLEIRGIPNSRVSMDARILELLTTESGDQSVEQLSRILHGMIDSSEVSPQHLQDLGWEMRCRVQLSWPSHGPLGSYRAIFQRQVEKRTERREIPQVTAGLSQNWHKWNRYANKPLREVAEKDQVTQWREYLSGRLPDYMTPTAYVMLDALPLTPNGKLDRKALPAPDMRKAEGRNGYPAPETPLEQIVVGIFEEVLKLDRVGERITSSNWRPFTPGDTGDLSGQEDVGSGSRSEERLREADGGRFVAQDRGIAEGRKEG